MIPEKNVDFLLENGASFLAFADAGCDIAISSRIRLARNLAGTPFPSSADADCRRVVAERVVSAVNSRNFGGKLHLFEMENLPPLDREILFERHLASREFIDRPQGAALIVREDEKLSLMINEEDHLRLQAISPGFCLRELFASASAVDDRLAKKLHFAFDKKLGYLTSCPTNVGTGMRASVMLHLPALTLSGRIGATIQGINKLNLAVRGMNGEGSENRGNFYQVSNQSTLGESEDEIIERFSAVIDQLINFERNARIQLLEKDRYGWLDFVGRSFGILRYAYKLTGNDALNYLSGLRAGVDMKLFDRLDCATVNTLWLSIQNAHLQKLTGHILTGNDRDIQRAALCREKLRAGI